MNDRFKFRCFSKKTKKMYEVDSLHLDSENEWVWVHYYNPIYDKDLKIQIEQPNAIILQCTGLKDKNGKLIYEGDIVKCGKWDLAARDSFRDDEYIEQVGVINYCNNRCRFVVNRTTIVSPIEISLPETCLGILGDCHIEVIGNIYENPELLEDTEQN